MQHLPQAHSATQLESLLIARVLMRGIAIIFLAFPLLASAQSLESHRPAAEKLIAAALHDSAAYHRLARLTDQFGARPSGSTNLERAIDWIVAEMKKDGLENVRTEPVMVTHWVRGEESLILESPRRVRLHMLGLGKSVGTPAGGISAPVLVVRDFAELRARSADAKGKIVVFNFPFDTTVHPFVGYGQAVQYRAYGVDSAARFGAVAVLSRSATPRSFQTPHTGGLSYADSIRTVPQIPGASITPEDAEMLHRLQRAGDKPVVRLTMGAQTLPNSPSRNVIAEVRGSERPDDVIVIGGHIDSWDVGTGAMDDGGGAVAAWEALRLIKKSGVRPKRTIRVVLWTNEELGLSGAFAYRDALRVELDRHILAMESDNGVFKPFGIAYSGSEQGLPFARELAHLLRTVGADSAQASGPEADVWPLNTLGVPTIAINTDPTRYFWYHHTEADTIDKLDPREIGLCVAVMAVVSNTVANMTGTVPRAPIAPPGG
jgi:carboxypeptidase Q